MEITGHNNIPPDSGIGFFICAVVAFFAVIIFILTH